MAKPNAVRGFGPLDNLLAQLRHGIAYRKLKPRYPIERSLDIGSGAYPAFLIGLQAKEKFGLEQTISSDMNDTVTAHNIQMVQCNLAQSEPLPFEDSFFDTITMLAVIEHIEPEKVSGLLSQIHHILKPGGIFMLTTPAAWTDKLLRTLAYLKLISREEIEDHKDVFTKKKLSDCLSQAGFKSIQTGTFECFMNLWATAQKD